MRAERRDSKRRSRREDRSTGFAAFRYYGDPRALASSKIANAIYKRAAKRVRVAKG